MRRYRWTTAALMSVFALAPAVASGQSATPGKWEVGGYGGFAFSTAPTGGTAATLPPGTSFTTPSGSRSGYVSSWLFGDGAALLNSVNALASPSTKITPLDAVLGSAAVSRGSGGGFGVRVARRFGSRYSAEFTVDYTSTPLDFTEAALSGIEAGRGSFMTAFKGLLQTGPWQNLNITAATTPTEGSRSELLTTGVFGFDLVTRGKLIPFVVGGGGVVHSGGDVPSATIVGNYSFAVTVPGVGPLPINETDRVTVRVAPHENAPVGVFGGGFRYEASPRWGIRGDVRFFAGGGTHDVLVDATPSVPKANPGLALTLTANANASIVFSSAAAVASSLSGPAISGLRTFTASGSAVRTNIAVGVYLRF